MLSESKINKYFDLAKKASEMSDFKRCKLGSVLVYKNKIISVGWNTTKQSPLMKKLNKERGFNVEEANNSIHAECMCLHRAENLNIDWSKASLFTFRAKKDGTTGNSRYCKACGAYIRSIGIRNIYYTLDNEEWCYEHL